MKPQKFYGIEETERNDKQVKQVYKHKSSNKQNKHWKKQVYGEYCFIFNY